MSKSSFNGASFTASWEKRWMTISALFCSVKILFVLLLLPAISCAANDAPLNEQEEAGIFDFLNAPQAYWSTKVTDFAQYLDSFFIDPRAFQETNESLVILGVNEVISRDNRPEFEVTGKARIALPYAKKYLHLLFESDPEVATTRVDPKTGTPVVDPAVVAPKSFAAAVRFQKPVEERWHFSTDIGIKLRSPLNPFVRARGSLSIPFDDWRTKLTETLFWFDSIGAGAGTQLDLETTLSDRVLFRSTTNATWLNEKQGFDLNQDFSLYQTLNNRAAVVYQISAAGVDYPSPQVTEYLAQIRVRYRLHRKWLFFEVDPQLHYPRETGYQMHPMLLLRLEMLFENPPLPALLFPHKVNE
jgi:hypothetical protein